MGGKTGDPCETRVTDFEGNNDQGLVIGGATSSPLFIAEMLGDPPPLNALECYGSTIPFVVFLERFETAPEDVEWAVFYGDADNLQFSEVGSIHKSISEAGRYPDFYKSEDAMFFFTLKSNDPETTPHKFECLRTESYGNG